MAKKQQEIEADIAATITGQARLVEADRRLAEYYNELAKKEQVKSFVPEPSVLPVALGVTITPAKPVAKKATEPEDWAGVFLNKIRENNRTQVVEILATTTSPRGVRLSEDKVEIYPNKDHSVTLKASETNVPEAIVKMAQLANDAASAGPITITINSGSTNDIHAFISELAKGNKLDTMNLTINSDILERIEQEKKAGNKEAGEILKFIDEHPQSKTSLFPPVMSHAQEEVPLSTPIGTKLPPPILPSNPLIHTPGGLVGSAVTKVAPVEVVVPTDIEGQEALLTAMVAKLDEEKNKPENASKVLVLNQFRKQIVVTLTSLDTNPLSLAEMSKIIQDYKTKLGTEQLPEPKKKTPDLEM